VSARPLSPADLPAAVPVFPLAGALLLPHTSRPLNIFEPRYLAMVDHALAGRRLIALVQPEDTKQESPVGDVALQPVGCLGRLVHFEESDDGRYFIVLEGITRIRLGSELETGQPFRSFAISASGYEADFEPGFGEEGVDRARFIAMVRDYAQFASLDLDWEEIERTSTADLVNLCCMLSPYGPAEKQVLLEAQSLTARADTLIALAEMEMVRSRPGNALQ